MKSDECCAAFILWRDGALLEKASIAQFCNEGSFLDEKVDFLKITWYGKPAISYTQLNFNPCL